MSDTSDNKAQARGPIFLPHAGIPRPGAQLRDGLDAATWFNIGPQEKKPDLDQPSGLGDWFEDDQ